MKKFARVLGVMMLGAATSGIAAEISSVVPGDVYYLWRMDRPNERVTVRAVDYSEGRAKVARPGGEVQWVRASSLLTSGEAVGVDIAAGAGVILGCLLISECRESATSAPPPPAPAVGGFVVTNRCTHDANLAIHYQETNGTWLSRGWWTVAAGKSVSLGDQNGKAITTTKAEWAYYAETTDGSNLAWQGDIPRDYDGRTLPMVIAKDNSGDSEWTLTCPGMGA